MGLAGGHEVGCGTSDGAIDDGLDEFVKSLLCRLQMAFAHDSVRVLQCFIQFSSHQQRLQVYEELKGERHLLVRKGQNLLHNICQWAAFMRRYHQ